MKETKMPLKVHRVKVNLTQEQVAKLLNVNKATYASWEKYITYPNALQLINLANIFQCSMDDIFFETTLATG